MASKFETIISKALSRKKPDTQPARPRRTKLEDLSPDIWGVGPWSAAESPQPPSITKSLPTSSQAPRLSERAQSVPLPLLPPPPPKQRRYVNTRQLLVSESEEERLNRLETDNDSLREANDVLYRQNADYKVLVQEYRALQDQAITVIDEHLDAVEILEDMVKGLGSDAKAYRLARSKAQKVERDKIKDWKTFVDVKAESGI